MKKIASIAACLLIARVAVAQTYCVRQGATGSADGSDWANAFTDLPSSLVRGATYYVAAGNYGMWTFDDPESGSQLITIKKATVAEHGTATGWSDSYASGTTVTQSFAFLYGYYTIDGVTGGGPGSWESGFGIRVTFGGLAQLVSIRGTNWGTPPLPTHITLEHIDFDGSSGSTPSSNGLVGATNAAPGDGTNDLAVRYCYFHDLPVGGNPISIFYANNVVIEYSEMSHMSFDATHHAEAVETLGSNDLTIRYNRFVDCAGTGVVIVFEGTGGQAVNQNIQVYGNVAYCDSWIAPSGYTSSAAQGFFGMDTGADPVVDAKIYNNTIVNCTGNAGANWGVYIFDGTGNQVYNNLWVNSWLNIGMVGSGNEEDYNTAVNCTDGAALQGANDTIYSSGDPFVNQGQDDFNLTAPTDPGLQLPAPYDVDMLRHTARADGSWDRGALQYADGSVNPSGADGGRLPTGDAPAGCACNTGGARPGGGAVAGLLAFVGWWLSRRRR